MFHTDGTLLARFSHFEAMKRQNSIRHLCCRAVLARENRHTQRAIARFDATMTAGAAAVLAIFDCDRRAQDRLGRVCRLAAQTRLLRAPRIPVRGVITSSFSLIIRQNRPTEPRGAASGCNWKSTARPRSTT